MPRGRIRSCLAAWPVAPDDCVRPAAPDACTRAVPPDACARAVAPDACARPVGPGACARPFIAVLLSDDPGRAVPEARLARPAGESGWRPGTRCALTAPAPAAGP